MVGWGGGRRVGWVGDWTGGVGVGVGVGIAQVVREHAPANRAAGVCTQRPGLLESAAARCAGLPWGGEQDREARPRQCGQPAGCGGLRGAPRMRARALKPARHQARNGENSRRKRAAGPRPPASMAISLPCGLTTARVGQEDTPSWRHIVMAPSFTTGCVTSYRSTAGSEGGRGDKGRPCAGAPNCREPGAVHRIDVMNATARTPACSVPAPTLASRRLARPAASTHPSHTALGMQRRQSKPGPPALRMASRSFSLSNLAECTPTTATGAPAYLRSRKARSGRTCMQLMLQRGRGGAAGGTVSR